MTINFIRFNLCVGFNNNNKTEIIMSYELDCYGDYSLQDLDTISLTVEGREGCLDNIPSITKFLYAESFARRDYSDNN